MSWEEKLIQKIEKKIEKKDSATILLSVMELINSSKYDQLLLEESLNETIQLILINKNPKYILKIKNPSNEAILLSLEKQPQLLKEINKQYTLKDEILMYILSKDFNLISEIENPSDKIKYFYLSQNTNLHYSLANWNYSDPELRKKVYHIDPTFIKFMNEYLTQEEYYSIIKDIPEVACYKPKSVKKIPLQIQKHILDSVNDKLLTYTSFLTIFDIGLLQEEISLKKAKNDTRGGVIENTLHNLMKHYKKEEYDMSIEQIVSVLNNNEKMIPHI
ncbi:hypothetical protein KHQ81_15795 (plasmid) [Mycoplasmatota bacterium]|nr:hypothetical protein KHQ81_15795 [Mycoplasmatota bacterium]